MMKEIPVTHTDHYGRSLSLNVEELTITEPTCTGEKATTTAALPEGTEGLF